MTIARHRVIPPPALFLLCLIAGSLVHRFRPVSIGPYSFLTGLVAGAAALAVAVGLATWGIRELKRHGTSIEPGDTPVRLVTSGPFRFTRNPLYLALAIALAGIALAINSLWLLLFCAVLVVLLDRLVVAGEEATNRQTFGPEFSRYTARVRRWV